MKIFVTVPFQGIDNKEEVEHLCALIQNSGFDDFCFVRDVEKYKKMFNDPKELMKRAKQEIQKSDVLLIDMSDKSTGRAIEAGIAFSFHKKIVFIMKKGTLLNNPSRGIADAIIEYDSLEEITPQLKKLYLLWKEGSSP
jgi:nucleoside 2-deoxyribosyltransferase